MFKIPEYLCIFNFRLKIEICMNFGRGILILVLLTVIAVREIQKHIRRTTANFIYL